MDTKDKTSIIEDLAKRQVVEDIIQNVVGEMGADEQDLAQDIYVDLLNKDEEKIVSMSPRELKYFVSRMVMNNVASKTSPFYYKYRKNSKYVNIEDIKDVV